jgi:hypothetical protein
MKTNLIAYTRINPENRVTPIGSTLLDVVGYLGGESMIDVTYRLQCRLCELYQLMKYDCTIHHNIVTIDNTTESLHIVKASLKTWRKIAELKDFKHLESDFDKILA